MSAQNKENTENLRNAGPAQPPFVASGSGSGDRARPDRAGAALSDGFGSHASVFAGGSGAETNAQGGPREEKGGAKGGKGASAGVALADQLAGLDKESWWRSRLRRVTWPMTLWLTVCWMCVFTSIAPLVVLSGVLVAVAAQVTFAAPPDVQWRINPVACVVLIGRFLWDLVVSGLQVSWIVISGKPAHTDTVLVHIHSTVPAHVTLLTALLNLVPGTMVVSLDSSQSTITLNVLNMEVMGGVAGVHRSVHLQEQRLLNAVAGGLP